MRLTSKERVAIRTAAADAFGTDVIVRVFGSRLDDSRRGGDIDLLVELPAYPTPTARSTFRRLLDRNVGERAYDILLVAGGDVPSLVHRKALAEGVAL